MNTAELTFLASVIRKAEGTYVGAFTAATRSGDHAAATEYGALADECRIARELIDSGGTAPVNDATASDGIVRGTKVRKHSGANVGKVMVNHKDGYVSVRWPDATGTIEAVRDLIIMEG